MKRRRKQRGKLYRGFVKGFAYVYVFFKVVCSKAKYRRFFIGLIAALVALVLLLTGIFKYAEFNSKDTNNQALRDSFIIVQNTDNSNLSGTIQNDRISAQNADELSDMSEKSQQDILFEKAVWSMEHDASDALWYGAINVDLDGLREVNKDIIGWLYFEAADISYPVLYSGDDETYLRMTYDGEYSTAGSIFLEGLNDRDFSDKHILIYGHNMRNMTMFGQLKMYKTDPDYYPQHQYFQLFHKNEATGETIIDRYHIFACKDVRPDDGIYYVYDMYYQNLAQFVADTIRSNSMLRNVEDITIDNDSQVITLSTCSAGDDRFVVSAVKCGTCILK